MVIKAVYVQIFSLHKHLKYIKLRDKHFWSFLLVTP